ncbi:GIY-YIG nuclease family protein [Raoultella planticola]|uniref:GIY-YIG nuclease family protein n=1 Tax=Raoultella planticola TaxID=575 RepID=UPI00388EC22D
MINGGWIYVFMTASDYSRYKVGFTERNPMLRLKQLRTGDPKIGFEVAFFIPNSLGIKLSKLEVMLHKELGHPIEFLDEKKSEWFKGKPTDVWLELQSLFTKLGYEVTDIYQKNQNKIVRFWEGDIISLYSSSKPINDNVPPPW